MCDSATSEYSDLWTRLTTSRHNTPVTITFDFSAETTRLSRSRASSNATRAMRSISLVV